MTRIHARPVWRPLVSSAFLAATLLTVSRTFAQQPMLSGTASFRERIALPENAAFEATVRDITRSDAASELIGRTRVEPIQQLPISFAIPYDPNLLKPGHRYTIQARIVAGGQLLFATVDPIPVFEDGQATPVDLLLPRSSGIAREELAPPPSQPAARIGPPTLLGPSRDAPSAQVPAAPSPVPPLQPQPQPGATAARHQAPQGLPASPPVDATGIAYAPLAPLPATFAGTMPCADCDGIVYTLAMSPDRAFTLQLEYLGRAGDPGFVYRGQWVLDEDSRVLTLSGDAQRPLAFAIKDPNTLRMLDASGREIVSDQNYDLTRTRTLDRQAQTAPAQPSIPQSAAPQPAAPQSAAPQSGAPLPAPASGASAPGYLLRGFYRSAGGESQFVECGGGRPVPVSPQQGEGAELQQAYERSQRQPGEQVLVEVEGRIAIGPRPDGSSLGRVLVVDRFVGLRPGENCTPAEVRASAATPDVPAPDAAANAGPPQPKAPPPPAEPDAELRGTYWRLTRIGSQSVSTPNGLEEPHLVLDPDRRDFAGHSGCNGFGGQFFIDKHYLTFSLGPSTLMACDDGMEQERAYRTALEKTEGWSVAGSRLTLYDAAGAATLRFEAEDDG